MIDSYKYDYINSAHAKAFYQRLRRHEANVFNAFFFDKESITEAQIAIRVRRAAKFFDLPEPAVLKGSECLATITYTDFSELGSEIRYDPGKLQDIGVNNVDAFDAILTHELSHQFLARRRFNFCRNKNWSIELACDFIVGVRCSADMLASGKYKYAVGQMRESETHPAGEFRHKAVKAGFDFAEWLSRRGQYPTAQLAIIGINKFLCQESARLNASYHAYLTTRAQAPTAAIEIMNLPDTNLIKQAILKIEAERARNHDKQSK